MKTEYKFNSNELENQLKNCASNKITELTVSDLSFTSDKKRLLHFIKKVQEDAPELFVSLKILPENIDSQILAEVSNINCSLEIPLVLKKNQNDVAFFDSKFLQKKVNLLNDFGTVFGFDITFAEEKTDSLKLFKERVDFAVSSFANHIDFPQTENIELSQSACVSGTFSANDIKIARNISFACRTFYSAGRAVPWFNYVLKSLKLKPSSFFEDFSEWQKCNNCDFKSGFVPENVSHQEIEKMQLLFLQLKFEEKKLNHLFTAVNDIVCINGAFSRLVGENTITTIETEYNPEDLLGPEVLDIKAFCNDVCMEHCTVQIYFNEYGEPDFKILS